MRRAAVMAQRNAVGGWVLRCGENLSAAAAVAETSETASQILGSDSGTGSDVVDSFGA